MASCCLDEKVLLSAEDLPIRGMILASMDATLVHTALSVSYPIILIEGFGKLAMNHNAFNILVSGARREAAIVAETWNRSKNTRPEVVIVLPEGVRPELLKESLPLAVGQVVRVVSPPYKSLTGTVTNLQPGQSVLPGGLRAQTAGVRLMNGDIVQVPLSNLEIIV